MIFKILKTPLLALFIALTAAGILCANNITNTTYGFLTETYPGINLDSVVSTDTDRGYLGVWGSAGCYTLSTLPHCEGSLGTQLNTWPSSGGFYLNFGTSTYMMDRNFSSYGGGTIEFDLLLDSITFTPATVPSDIHIQLKWNVSGGVQAVSDDKTLAAYAYPSGAWQHVSIPLSHFKNSNYNSTTTTWYLVNQPGGTGLDDGINHIDMMGFFMADGTYNHMFWMDNLVWKSTTTGSMGITVKKRNNDSVVIGSSLTWTSPTLGKWMAADEYIQVNNDYFDYVSSTTAGTLWGIQIYTDNKAANASPKYTGLGDPVGLVNASTTTQTLPLAWRVVDFTTTSVNNIQQGGSGYPAGRIWDSDIGPQYPCFLWMMDKSSSTFVNSADYQTVWDKRGIQHAEATWGGALSPNYIYIAADFINAKTPATYTTGKLTVELFHD